MRKLASSLAVSAKLRCWCTKSQNSGEMEAPRSTAMSCPTRSSNEENFNLPASAARTKKTHLSRASGSFGKWQKRARSLVIAERSEDCVALAPKDQPRGASPGKLFKRGFLAHNGKDLLEDFGTEPRRL